jgi:hypothetical protein
VTTRAPARPVSASWPVYERSILGGVLGLPGYAAILIALGFTGLGVFIDLTRISGLGTIFKGCYFVGCVLAVCWVKRRALFGPMVQPPLLLALAVPAVVLASGDNDTGSSGLTDHLLSIGTPLVNGFPTMAVATAFAVAIGICRYVLQRPGPDAPVPPPRPASGGSASRRPPGAVRPADRGTPPRGPREGAPPARSRPTDRSPADAEPGARVRGKRTSGERTSGERTSGERRSASERRSATERQRGERRPPADRERPASDRAPRERPASGGAPRERPASDRAGSPDRPGRERRSEPPSGSDRRPPPERSSGTKRPPRDRPPPPRNPRTS